MAGKPELSAPTGVQNVVVYVSDGNFAQAYTVGHHQQQNASSAQYGPQHVAAYGGAANQLPQHHHHHQQQQHALAVAAAAGGPPPKMLQQQQGFPPPLDKHHHLSIKPPDYATVVNAGSPGGPGGGGAAAYFNPQTAVISSNGFSLQQQPQPASQQQSLPNGGGGYVSGGGVILGQRTISSGYSGGPPNGVVGNVEILSVETAPGRPGAAAVAVTTSSTSRPIEIKVRAEECSDNRGEGYSSADSGYVSVIGGGEGLTQSVRCESVRSETAESSCSSLSSADEAGALVVVQQPQQQQQVVVSPPQQQSSSEMVVYDGSVSVRPGGGGGGVVLATVGSPLVRTVSASIQQQQHQPTAVGVPFGWKRIVNNSSVVYISPSNTALSSLDQVKDYLLTPGTCKCGLECPLKYEAVFNYDPKVLGKPWVFSPDTNTGDLTKLCNHKRKIMSMASIECKPLDPAAGGAVKFRKDFPVKRKKRRLGNPYSSGVPAVGQIVSQRGEKVALGHPIICKEGPSVINPQFSAQGWNGGAAIPNQHQLTARGYLSGPGSNVQYFRYQHQDPHVNNRVLMETQHVASGDVMVTAHSTAAVPASVNNISQHQSPQQQLIQQHPQNIPNYHHANVSPSCSSQNPGQIQIQHQHIIAAPNGQIISVQGPIPQQQQQQQQHHHQQQQNHPAPNSGGAVIASGSNGIIIHSNTVIPSQNHPAAKVFVNHPPLATSNAPGRPQNLQMVPIISSNQKQHQEIQQRIQQQQQNFCTTQPFQSYQNVMQQQQYDLKNIRPQFNSSTVKPPEIQQQFNALIQQGPHGAPTPILVQQQKPSPSWSTTTQNRSPNPLPNTDERVPPLHQPPSTVWSSSSSMTEEVNRKKAKFSKSLKKRTATFNNVYDLHSRAQLESSNLCPNIDVRQIPGENDHSLLMSQSSSGQIVQEAAPSGPSFMEDPSGYLAQQTALLNSTISRQTGVNNCGGGFVSCNSPIAPIRNSTPQMQDQQQHNLSSGSEPNEVPLPSNMLLSQANKQSPSFNNRVTKIQQQQVQQQVPQTSDVPQVYNQTSVMAKGPADSTGINEQQQQPCRGCIAENAAAAAAAQYQQQQQQNLHHHQSTVDQSVTSHRVVYQQQQSHSRPNSQPNTPSSSNMSEDPVISSTSVEKMSAGSPDSRPIQGGTISTSNVSPADGSQSNPSTPNPHISTTPQPQQQTSSSSRESAYLSSASSYQPTRSDDYCSSIVTTMASGRTVGSNTITSVLAGRANTSTVSVNSPVNLPMTTVPSIIAGQSNPLISASSMPQQQQQSPSAISINVSKSPLEMVQSVVSSIQVPQSQHQQQQQNLPNMQQQISPLQIIKHSPTQGLPPGHILVSSGGQLIMASTSNNTGQPQNVMPPPPPKILTSQHQNAMPPISVSPMVTNVTASMTQVIPAVAQQVLGQQTVLVNALPAPFVIQPGVTMTMDGMTVGQNVQIPTQLVATGNVIQQQLQLDGSDPSRLLTRTTAGLLSPESKKKGKKRKMSSQTIASMLQIAAASQQNSAGVMMSPQSFPQQIQMAHSPQSLTAGPVMQALTIVPGKAGGPPQIVMNGGQPVGNPGQFGTQQLIATANSQQTQHINLLQPVNLINGTTGAMVQNFPTIQQFIVPNLGGMVMNADGTATILQDTSNLGMQLQLQNVNGQNVLTPVQNNNVFNGGQSILAAGPAGMVIRAPGTSQGKIIQQQHSPGAQFLSPNGNQFVVNGAQFSGQLSPLVANVSPTQVTFSTAPQPIRPNSSNQHHQANPEFLQCGQMGQTLMVPTANITVSSANQQNTTYVQQNTTIVQQQTTMVSNNQQLQNLHPQAVPANQHHHQQQQQHHHQQNNQNLSRTTTLNVDQNFILNNDNRGLQAVLVHRQSPQISCRHSVSTQTAVNQNNHSVTTNTFCQTASATASTISSPPDTTTHSPLALEGQSPPTADTTTHSGSTDDGLSPAPSNCSGSFGDIMTLQQAGSRQQQSCSMAMVHCISSSEPDSGDIGMQTSEDWVQTHHVSTKQQQQDFSDVSSVGGSMHMVSSKKSSDAPIHMYAAESSTVVSGIQFLTDLKAAQQEDGVSSRNFEKMAAGTKRKHSDTLVVMENRHMQLSLFEDDEEIERHDRASPHTFVTGDLVWGPARGRPAWPGKLVEVCEDAVVVRWFGGEKAHTRVDPCALRTLTEGLDAHHRARKNCRKSRKLDAQLENAIQEAMSELDKDATADENDMVTSVPVISPGSKKAAALSPLAGRLRSGSQR